MCLVGEHDWNHMLQLWLSTFEHVSSCIIKLCLLWCLNLSQNRWNCKYIMQRKWRESHIQTLANLNPVILPYGMTFGTLVHMHPHGMTWLGFLFPVLVVVSRELSLGGCITTVVKLLVPTGSWSEGESRIPLPVRICDVGARIGWEQLVRFSCRCTSGRGMLVDML